jgi:hydroxypyruvate isomerase
MPKLAPNLSTLFLELPLSERPAAAAGAGFKGAELRFVHGLPVHELSGWFQNAGLELVGFNAHPGQLANGELGLASLADHRPRFEASFTNDLRIAGALAAANMHVLAGKRDLRMDKTEQFDNAVSAYGWAAGLAHEHGVVLLIEPLAPVAAPGYFVSSLEGAVELVEAVGAPNLKILFDLYHLQLNGGNIVTRFTAAAPLIGHVQIAAVPARTEPDGGELNLEFVLGEFDRLGYGGWVGCEYTPENSTLEGLDWARKWLD